MTQVKIIYGNGTKLEFRAAAVIMNPGLLEVHVDRNVNCELVDYSVNKPPPQPNLTDVLASNLAAEPWLSMNALADHLDEIGRSLEADGFRFLIKGKHIPSMIMDLQGKEAWHWRSMGFKEIPNTAHGDYLPELVFNSNRISKVSKIQPTRIIHTGRDTEQPLLRESLFFKCMLDAWAHAVWAWGDVQTIMKNIKAGG